MQFFNKIAQIWNSRLLSKEFRRREAAIIDRAPRVISEIEKIYEQASANTDLANELNEQVERIAEGEETGDIASLANKIEELSMENKRLRDKALDYKKELDDLEAKLESLYAERNRW